MTYGDAFTTFARAATLLIVSDFDGTLSPLVDDPALAMPIPHAHKALLDLAEMPRTHVAMLSSRGRDDLLRRMDPPGKIVFIGSHGAELPGRPPRAEPEALAELPEFEKALQKLVAPFPRARLERKPVALTLHTRTCAPDVATTVQDAAVALARHYPHLHAALGRDALEFHASPVTKAQGFAELREHTGECAAMFLGDDPSYEGVFAALGPGDLGVKVGSGTTAATIRVASPAEAAGLLAGLAARRAAAVGSA